MVHSVNETKIFRKNRYRKIYLSFILCTTTELILRNFIFAGATFVGTIKLGFFKRKVSKNAFLMELKCCFDIKNSVLMTRIVEIEIFESRNKKSRSKNKIEIKIF